MRLALLATLFLCGTARAEAPEADPKATVCAERSDNDCVCVGHRTADRILVERRVGEETGTRPPCECQTGWWGALGAVLGAAAAAMVALLL